MNAVVKYRLSEAGRKASILSGGNGHDVQIIEVANDSPEFAAVVQDGTISNSGKVELDRSPTFYPSYDQVMSVAGILADIADRKAADEAAAAKKRAEVTANTLAALAERRTTKKQEVVVVRDGVAIGRAEYEWEQPKWPYLGYDDVVVNSPEAVAWIAELEAAKASAEADAQARAEADLAQSKIEAEAEAIAAAEQKVIRTAKKESLGALVTDLMCDIEDGAFVTVPSGMWSSHNRAKNWLAIVSPDPSSPGGLMRDFAAKAKGDSYYIAPTFAVGDAVEFGSDYYSGSGRKNPKRWYGFVIAQTSDCVILRPATTGKDAAKSGAKWAETHAMPASTDPVDLAIARVNSEGGLTV